MGDAGGLFGTLVGPEPTDSERQPVNTTSSSSEPSRSLSRRTLATGAAWSLPVIAVAASAPLASASPGTAPCIDPADGACIADWKGDHHYGSDEHDPARRSYDFPVFVTDAAGTAVEDATVTVLASGSNSDGDLLGVYAYPAPSNGGPESSPSPAATLTHGPAGRYLFAVNTQNLSTHERPATATLTITATTSAGSATSVVTVQFSETD
ncbi:transcriptional initiation protein Tat [Rathayibacter sp. VKM Ac-2754]|uniref:transcriptional initiation protein Tat n=1 Tax=Rathayibacter sp. VKM Ac-2754 TaxID=2609251 RepID=UPI001F2B098E|nr:transcriptional initiation protein Tat [Rathayibacter sp. VKM Ac-2754]